MNIIYFYSILQPWLTSGDSSHFTLLMACCCLEVTWDYQTKQKKNEINGISESVWLFRVTLVRYVLITILMMIPSNLDISCVFLQYRHERMIQTLCNVTIKSTLSAVSISTQSHEYQVDDYKCKKMSIWDL